MLSFDVSAFFTVGYNQKVSVYALQRNDQIIVSKTPFRSAAFIQISLYEFEELKQSVPYVLTCWSKNKTWITEKMSLI